LAEAVAAAAALRKDTRTKRGRTAEVAEGLPEAGILKRRAKIKIRKIGIRSTAVVEWFK
jgi:hypothetical protein